MRVSIICVSTICGRIEPGGIGSRRDRTRLLEARSKTGASLLGAASLRKSDPEMRCSDGTIPSHRIRALISESGCLPADRKIFQHAPRPLVFTSASGHEKLVQQLTPEQAELVILPPSRHGGLSLAEALRHIESRGVNELLIEGGGRLNYSALKQGIVDEIHLTIAPKLTGNIEMSMLVSGPGHLGDPFLTLEACKCQLLPDTNELFLTYRVRRKDTKG